MPGRWVVVVPVKDAAVGKTRLSGALDDRSRTALARAMALDTITAAAACAAVRLVLVVTSDEVVARDAAEAARAAARGASAGALERSAGGRPEMRAGGDGSPAGFGGAAVQVLPEPSHATARSGLDAAAVAGVERARRLAPAAPVAVLLGDLPALRPADLEAALELAGAHGRAMVADEPGTGTTLLTVSGTATFDSRFGAGSARAHRELGYVLLEVPVASTLRRDIDLPADLGTLLTLRPGPRTARLLDRLLPATGRAAGGEPGA